MIAKAKRRVIVASFSSTAPLAAEMKKFVEDCLDVHVMDGYGLTELQPAAVRHRQRRATVTVPYDSTSIGDL